MILPYSSLGDFFSSGDFQCLQVRVMESKQLDFRFSVVAIVYANTEYHVPSTVIVHYHVIQKC